MMPPKYRAWCYRTKQYIYVACVDFVNHNVDGLPIHMQECQDSITIPTLATLEQCTGYRDSCNVEIYIGDIISLNGRYMEGDRQFYGYITTGDLKVIWVPDSYAANIRERYQEDGLPGNVSSMWSIVGNHKENPELMDNFVNRVTRTRRSN